MALFSKIGEQSQIANGLVAEYQGPSFR